MNKNEFETRSDELMQQIYAQLGDTADAILSGVEKSKETHSLGLFPSEDIMFGIIATQESSGKRVYTVAKWYTKENVHIPSLRWVEKRNRLEHLGTGVVETLGRYETKDLAKRAFLDLCVQTLLLSAAANPQHPSALI